MILGHAVVCDWFWVWVRDQSQGNAARKWLLYSVTAQFVNIQQMVPPYGGTIRTGVSITLLRNRTWRWFWCRWSLLVLGRMAACPLSHCCIRRRENTAHLHHHHHQQQQQQQHQWTLVVWWPVSTTPAEPLESRKAAFTRTSLTSAAVVRLCK